MSDLDLEVGAGAGGQKSPGWETTAEAREKSLKERKVRMVLEARRYVQLTRTSDDDDVADFYWVSSFCFVGNCWLKLVPRREFCLEAKEK